MLEFDETVYLNRSGPGALCSLNVIASPEVFDNIVFGSSLMRKYTTIFDPVYERIGFHE